MPRTITLSPEEMYLIASIMLDDYQRQEFANPDEISEIDAELQSMYDEIISKLQSR